LNIASKPYTVRELAGKLLNGNWCAVRHENAGPDCDLEHWKKCLDAWCTEFGVAVDYIDIKREDITVAYNLAAVPTFDQVQQTIARAIHERWMERT
jgi:hypothetical protein